jgi:hypothetical protein
MNSKRAIRINCYSVNRQNPAFMAGIVLFIP